MPKPQPIISCSPHLLILVCFCLLSHAQEMGRGGGGGVTLSHFRRYSSIRVRFPPRESYAMSFFSCPTRIAIIDELTALKSDNRSKIYDTGSNIAQSSVSLDEIRNTGRGGPMSCLREAGEP
jgi:hypothetical protein